MSRFISQWNHWLEECFWTSLTCSLVIQHSMTSSLTSWNIDLQVILKQIWWLPMCLCHAWLCTLLGARLYSMLHPVGTHAFAPQRGSNVCVVLSSFLTLTLLKAIKNNENWLFGTICRYNSCLQMMKEQHVFYQRAAHHPCNIVIILIQITATQHHFYSKKNTDCKL